jgi:hypothetical protein
VSEPTLSVEERAVQVCEYLANANGGKHRAAFVSITASSVIAAAIREAEAAAFEKAARIVEADQAGIPPTKIRIAAAIRAAAPKPGGEVPRGE